MKNLHGDMEIIAERLIRDENPDYEALSLLTIQEIRSRKIYFDGKEGSGCEEIHVKRLDLC